METKKGTCYSIGVGPGDPELLTVKALRTVERCRVIAAPRTKTGRMMALSILQGAMDLSGYEILPLSFPMTNDPSARAASHAEAAGQIREYLDRGEDVAMLTIGDPGIYATSSYVQTLLEEWGYAAEVVPGIPSFCASAAALGTSLAADDEELLIVPTSVEAEELVGIVDRPGTKILMKSGRKLPQVLALLEEKGLLETTVLAENVGLSGQRLKRHLTAADGEDAGYFVTLIVKDAGKEAAK